MKPYRRYQKHYYMYPEDMEKILFYLKENETSCICNPLT